MFRSRGNLQRKALNYRYVIKSHERINGGHIPYLSNVTLLPVLPSDVIPIRGTRQQNKNNNYILSPMSDMEKPIQKSLKVCHKNPRETKWRSYSLLIQCDPLSGITFPRNAGQRDKTTEQKQQLHLKSNVVYIWKNLYRKATIKVCHKNPRETKWRSFSLLI